MDGPGDCSYHLLFVCSLSGGWFLAIKPRLRDVGLCAPLIWSCL
jgi:hypothetical protein